MSGYGNFVDKVNVSCYGFLSISQVCVVLWWHQKVVAIRKVCRYIKILALYEKYVTISRYTKSWLVYTMSGTTLKDSRKKISLCKVLFYQKFGAIEKLCCYIKRLEAMVLRMYQKLEGIAKRCHDLWNVFRYIKTYSVHQKLVAICKVCQYIKSGPLWSISHVKSFTTLWKGSRHKKMFVATWNVCRNGFMLKWIVCPYI